MVSSIKSRRNHYEILGLKPGATDDEIAAAFATESRKIIQNPRVNEPDVREKARRVRSAHQTLRDPTKRAAYDASIGAGAKAPAAAPQAPAEPRVRPFVAAPIDKPEADSATPGDQHITQGNGDPAKDASTDRIPVERTRPEAQTNARTGLPEGLFVAAMAATAGKADAQADETEGAHSPESQAAATQPDTPPSASEPETPSVAAQADQSATADAPEAVAAPPPQPEPEAAPEIAAEPAPELAAEPAAERAYRFEDPGAGTAAFYGARRDRKVNRAAVGGVAAVAAALAAGAFWLWPSQNSVEPTSRSAAESQFADAGETGVPPDVLNGLPPEQTTTDDPFAGIEIAADGSYQSVTFADSGPIPTISPPPSGVAPPSGSAPSPGEATASTPAAAEPGNTTEAPQSTATAPAPAPNVAAAPQVADASVATNVPRRAQPAPDLRPATPPKLVRGTILNSDNRRGAFQGTVSVRFTVGANGRPTGCTPMSSSGNPRLDAYTCELVQQRLQFNPATTAQGQPVASEMRATYTWGRKRRSLTGRLLDIVR